jgi:uncharacterized membrane protein YqjE
VSWLDYVRWAVVVCTFLYLTGLAFGLWELAKRRRGKPE